ncbi:SDR family NAD(P)-dependent oxidoreductase [Marinobacterium aestuariivivens]|uniref:SDR family NAD(P)-dependent oxidoreductase n=1 Tax=Marinobacterium aestuariivivens TaxID=1698799 RepID=A0ABW1ZVP6_9GAMM
MSRQLEGKLALVTGGSRGIGLAIVRAFAAEGARVVFSYRSGARESSEAVAALRAEGGDVHAFQADVANEVEVLALFREVDRLGELDILVNNAGVIQEKPLLETSAADFDWVMGVNVRGQFLCGREALRRMAGRGGRLINMTSDLSYSGREDFSPYCASKAAVNALTRSWAREFAPQVLVNGIAPGPIDTDMLDVEHMTPEWRRKEEALTVLKRIGRPEEVASLAVFLAGPGSSYLTGQIVGPNGGSVMP